RPRIRNPVDARHALLSPTSALSLETSGRSIPLVADIPDADYFARCVLDRVITGHVRFAEDVDIAVESLSFINIHYRFSLRVQDGPKRPAVYAARHISGYADIIITRLYEKRSRAAGLCLDLVDNREVVVHLG